MAETPMGYAPPEGGPKKAKAPAVRLTPRQLEVLALLCEGLPNKLICRRLNISTGTVKIHIGSIMREFGVSSRLQAVVSAHRCGLLREPDEGAPQHLGHSTSAQPPMMVTMVMRGTSRIGSAQEE
jgi:DNA-binding CsgD family transcriptional regulator